MDDIQAWATTFLSSHENLRTYTPYLTRGYTWASTIKSYFNPLLTRATQNPDLATIALLLLIVFISLKVLNMLYQTFLFWLRMAARVVVWGGLGVLALWMYNRGPEGVVEDVQYWWDVWGKEHQYWRERERMARLQRQGGW